MPASAPLVPVRPAPRSLEPSPGPLEIFADGLAIEIRRDDRVLYDSPLEGSGFEPSVPRQTHYGSTLVSCPFCHDSRSAKGTHPSATGGPFRPLRKEVERRKCCRAGAVLVWNNRETEMANLVEIKPLFLALVGGSPGAEGVFLNQNLAIRSTSVF